MASPPGETPRGAASPTAKPSGLGSQGVIGVKICAAVFGVIILIYYILALSYSESPFWLIGVIFGIIGLGLGIAGIFIGNISISKRENIPKLNIIFLILSVIFLLAMPIFGSWEDPNTIGSSLWNFFLMLKVAGFAILFFLYIELAHASLRFSEIDDYVVTHNIKEFSVSSVIMNYTLWAAILGIIIFLFTALVLILQVLLSPVIQDVAPQFGFSLEYNSIYSLLISTAIIFVPIGIILTFLFAFFFKSRRSIIVKGKEDIVARRPEAVKVK